MRDAIPRASVHDRGNGHRWELERELVIPGRDLEVQVSPGDSKERRERGLLASDFPEFVDGAD